jgi:hypothetical protein
MAPMVIARLAHAAISTAMAVPLYNAFYASAAAWSPTAPPLMLSSSRTVPASLCLLGMCVVLTLSLRRTTKE